MYVVSTCALPVASWLWQPRPSAWALTVICRATFLLRPVECALAPEQDAPIEDDQHLGDDDRCSLHVASDLVPMKARADVTVVGHAYAPGGAGVSSLIARVRIAEIDKAIELHAERYFDQEGALHHGARAARLPVVYERAAGGPETSNPVGIQPVADPYGRVLLPSIQPPGLVISSAADHIPAIGFGPIAPSWPARREMLGRHVHGAPPDGQREPVPEDLDFGYFNHAPRDQQVAALRADERIVLENLHPEHPRLVTNLPGIRPRAVAEYARGSLPIALRCDTLWIDTDRSICTLTWRAQVPLESPEEEGRVIFSLESGGAAHAPSTGDVARRQLETADSTTGTLIPGVHSRTTAASRILSGGLPFVGAAEPAPSASAPAAPSAAPSFGMPFGAPPASVPSFGAPPGAAVPSPGGSAPSFGAPPGPAIPPPPPSAPSFVAPMGAPAAPSFGTPPKMPTAPMPAVPSLSGPPPVGTAPMPALPSVPSLSTPFSGGTAAPITQPPPAAPSFGAIPAPAPVTMGGDPPARSIRPGDHPYPPVRVPPPLPASPPSAARPAFWSVPEAPVPPVTSQQPMTVGQMATTNEVTPPPAPAPPSPPPAAEQTRVAAKPVEAKKAVQIVWFEPGCLPRVRTKRDWRPLLEGIEERPIDPDFDDPSIARDPVNVEDRRDVFEVLARAEAADEVKLPEAIERACRDDGKFVPPFLMVAGELRLPFDELLTLKAAVSISSPFAANDEGLKASITDARELLDIPDLACPPGVLEGFTTRIQEAFRKMRRASVPQTYLDEAMERTLLERRSYQRRDVFGGPHLRALLTVGNPGNGQRPWPLYLPQAVAPRLPMFVRFQARLLVEGWLQEDQYEQHPAALRGSALARVTPMPVLSNPAPAKPSVKSA